MWKRMCRLTSMRWCDTEHHRDCQSDEENEPDEAKKLRACDLGKKGSLCFLGLIGGATVRQGDRRAKQQRGD